MNQGWMTDRHEEVVVLSVERAMGIQRRPSPIHPTPKSTSLRLGNLESRRTDQKSYNYLYREMVSALMFRVLQSARLGEGEGFTE